MTKADMAKVIMSMTFRELKDVARELSGMIEPDVRKAPISTTDFLELLHDWAEANEP